MKSKNITEKIAAVLLVCIGIVTALPVLALFTFDQTMQVSYGVATSDQMITVLLQHRGIFQFILGTGIICAAFIPAFRIPIATTALLTKGSFTFMVLSNEAIRDQWPAWVAIFDIASVIILVTVAFAPHFIKRLQ